LTTRRNLLVTIARHTAGIVPDEGIGDASVWVIPSDPLSRERRAGMIRTASRPELPERLRSSWFRWTPLVLGVVIAVGALAFVGSRLLEPAPPTVKQVEFVNDSEYDLSIEVAGAAHDGWMGVVTAKAHATTTASEVSDQGPTWTFRFATQGLRGGELQLSRRDLERAQWRVEIPDRIAQKFRDAGARPSPS
jgi:hypothetical protein